MKVTSSDFQQNVGRYQDAALQAPVAITKNGRPHTVLMSAALFEVLVRGRIARPVEDLDDDTLKAIANSAVPPEFAALRCGRDDRPSPRLAVTVKNRESCSKLNGFPGSSADTKCVATPSSRRNRPRLYQPRTSKHKIKLSR